MAEDFGLEIKCKACGVKGHLDFHKFRVRITGGLEFLCPACKEVTVYIGRFGQDIKLERLKEDIKGAEQ